MTDLIALQAALIRMWWDAQVVITLRIAGMAQPSAQQQQELMRMVMEKGPAFARAFTAANVAALSGKAPVNVARAAVKPVARQARANRRRLTRSANA